MTRKKRKKKEILIDSVQLGSGEEVVEYSSLLLALNTLMSDYKQVEKSFTDRASKLKESLTKIEKDTGNIQTGLDQRVVTTISEMKKDLKSLENELTKKVSDISGKMIALGSVVQWLVDTVKDMKISFERSNILLEQQQRQKDLLETLFYQVSRNYDSINELKNPYKKIDTLLFEVKKNFLHIHDLERMVCDLQSLLSPTLK